MTLTPPSPAERLCWPADWGTRFLVTVDVEEEFDWRAPLDRVHRATMAMRAFPAAHRRFADWGTGLACMVDYPIVQDPAAVAILRRVVEDGRSAIGAQLHGWVTPPHDTADAMTESFPGGLPVTVEAAKIDRLTDAIAAAFDIRPTAYRAGRYGIGPTTFRLLAERGYRIDSSIRARYDYAPQGGPDFTGFDAHGFRRDGIVALPLTTVFTGAARRIGPWLYPRAARWRGALARTGLLQRVALTPEDMPLPAAIAAVDAALDDGVALLVLSFHSPSLVPGHTPYVRDAADLAGFYRWWDRMVAHLARRGVAATTLAEIARATDP